MDLDTYQRQARRTAIYPRQEIPLYPALGLMGEAGEVAEKVKKWFRDGTIDKVAVARELGDVLWYVANLADDLGFTMSDIADLNLRKLEDRARRDVLRGSGDDR
jgi:NTP pyrophosphatase (non-canonical NTP hydrolase)